jgi:polyhydroxyalkanoate synthesis regulator phasin
MLVVENLDRLSRQDPRTARRWIEDLTDAGISIAVCTPDLLLDPTSMSGHNIGVMIQHLLESVRANAESNRKSEVRPVITEKHRAKARRGEAFSKRLPLWLEIKDGKPSARPDRAPLIEQIYRWCETEGYQGICARLNASVPPWNGKRWNIGYIKDILHSPSVEGEYHPKTGLDRVPTGEIITGYYPRVVSAELVARARAAIIGRGRTGGQKFKEAQNLFSGVLQCADCGGAMTRTLTGSGKKYPYLVCRAGRAGSCANKTQFRYDHFERAALREILHLALDSTHFVKADEAAPLVALVASLRKDVELLTAQVASDIDLLRRFQSDALGDALIASEAALREKGKALAKAQDDLDHARGKVSDEEHMRRVIEVRRAIDDPDTETRQQARRKVRDAIQSVVGTVVFDRTWRTNLHAERSIWLIMRGNHLGFHFDGAGKLIERADFTAYADDPDFADLSERMVAEGSTDVPDTKRVFADIMRRMHAATA